MYENHWVSLLGTTLDLKLPTAGPMSFRLRARYLDEGYEAEDSPGATHCGPTGWTAERGRTAHSMRIGYALTPQQSLSLDLSAAGLGSGIKDGPLVERSNQAGLLVACLYRL